MRRERSLISFLVAPLVLLTGLTVGSVYAQAPPATPVPAPCGAGWMASAMAVAGTVQGGGILQGKAAVCGYRSAAQALMAVLDTCDAQTAGGCRQANSLKVVWGQGDGVTMHGSETCESVLPLVATASCTEAAVSQLRAVGVR